MKTYEAMNAERVARETADIETKKADKFHKVQVLHNESH